MDELSEQIKVNFLCRDSIFSPLRSYWTSPCSATSCNARGMKGIRSGLPPYCRRQPMACTRLQPEHDLFIQQTKLKNTLRHLMGEDQITHLGLEYYT